MPTIPALITGFLVGLFVTLLFLQVSVPLAIQMAGRHRFVDSAGLDSCTYLLSAGVINAILYSNLSTTVGPWKAAALFPAVAAVWSLHAFAWLLWNGVKHNRKEFRLHADGITRLSDQQSIMPTWVELGNDYLQTDAFRGYSVYSLCLHDANGSTVRNGYISDDGQKDDLRRIFAVVPNCRALDLWFVWREAPLRWLQIQLDQQWVPLLCSPQSGLSEAEVDWWRQWLLPKFPEDGHAIVAVAELGSRLEELWRQQETRIATEERLCNQRAKLQRFLNGVQGSVEIMAGERYTQMLRQVAPEGATFSRDPENELILVIVPNATTADNREDPQSTLLRATNANDSNQNLLRAAQSGNEATSTELLRASRDETQSSGKGCEPR